MRVDRPLSETCGAGPQEQVTTLNIGTLRGTTSHHPRNRPASDLGTRVQRPKNICAVKLRLRLETVGHLAAAFSKLRHDLLVQPDIHVRRAIESAGVAEFLGQLFAGGKTAVQFQQLHQIDDRFPPIEVFALFVVKFLEDCFDVSS